MLSYTQKAGSIELWLSRQQLQETFAQVHSDPCASDWVNVNMSLSKFAQVQTGSNANWWEASQENCPWTTSFHHCGQSSVYVHSTHDALPVLVAAELKMIEETHAGILASHFPTRSVYNSLSKRYWWERKYSVVHCYCRGRFTCAAYGETGRRRKAPTLVSGPLDRESWCWHHAKCLRQSVEIDMWLYLWTAWPSGWRPLLQKIRQVKPLHDCWWTTLCVIMGYLLNSCRIEELI